MDREPARILGILGRHARCFTDGVRLARVTALVLVGGSVACTTASVGEVRPDPQSRAHVAAAVPGGFGGPDDAQPHVAETPKEILAGDMPKRCPEGMVDIEGRFCIDRYEASLVEVLPGGAERPFSPFATVDGRKVRAVSEANVKPQGYISAKEAQRACAASGKRLCRANEWKTACRGPEKKTYGYADQRQPGRCNDRGRNPVIRLYGARWTPATMNQPMLNQLDGTLARTGEHAGCTNGYGVYDMVGNLHEWVADARGAFQGGYYLDVASVGHGEGCGYVTTAHETRYHDYSTGFRCCADFPGATPPRKKR